MYEIIINKSVGPFILGAHITEYLQAYEFDFSKRKSDYEDWDSYIYKDGIISIYVKDGIIESIACRGDCYIDDCFLYQIDFDAFCQRFGINKLALPKDAVYVIDDILEDVYEIDTFGLQVWVNSENKIETIFVSIIE